MMYPRLSIDQANLVRSSSNPDLTLGLISRQVAIEESLKAWLTQLGKPIVWNNSSPRKPLLQLGDKIEVEGY